MVASSGQVNNKKLKWLLGVLVIMIVGLVASIAVIVVQKDGSEGEVRGEVRNVVMDVEQVLVDIREEILPMTIDEAVEYLDAKVATYSDTEIVPQILIIKMYALINDGYPEDAIEVATALDDNELDDSVRMDYYAALSMAYRGLGDVEDADYYLEKHFALYNIIFGTIENNDN